MTDDAKKTLTPKLRFPEFGDKAWELKALDGVSDFVDERVSVSEINRNDYVSTENLEPEFGGLSPASSFPASGSVTRYRANDILAANIRPYLKKIWLADKAGGASNDVIVVRARAPSDHLYLSHVLKSDRFVSYVMSGAKGLKMPRGDVASIRVYPVPLPPTKAEQQKIAECLSTLDELIGAESQKLGALKAHKKGLMQQLFPREGEPLPRLRYPEFVDHYSWTDVPLASILRSRNVRRVPAADVPLYSLTIESGVTAKSDRYNREFLVRDSANKKYKLVLPADIVYNPSNLRWGAINYSQLDHSVVVSPIYEVLHLKDTTHYDLRFIAYAVMRDEQIKRFVTKGQGTLIERIAVKVEDFLSTELSIPTNVCEQQRIASCLSSLDDLIATQSDKLEALKTHKKGLMQQLFPSPVEVEV